MVSAVVAWAVAQFLKPFIQKFMKGGPFNPHLFLTTGGMPSSHTSTVTALSTSIALTKGVGSAWFAIAAIFSIITIHDAMNIRMEAGKQADVINEWSKILSDIYKDKRFKQENLKTMLGHSFSQVIGGIILGLLVGFLVTWLITPW